MTHKIGAYIQSPEKSHSHVPGKVLIAGGLLVDDVAIATENISLSCSNPVTWKQKLGGVATNVARVVAQQLDCLLIANVGSDKAGEQLTHLLSELAIPCSPTIWSGETSDRYSVILNPDGDLFVGLAAAQLVEKMQWQQIQAHWPEDAPSAVVLDANLSEHCLAETVNAITTQYQSGTRIFALAVSPIKTQRWKALAHTLELFFCNRLEAVALTGLPERSTTDSLGDALLACGFRQFVITDASNPVLVQQRGARTLIPIAQVNVSQNVNGAGDAMAGATITQLLLGDSLPQAVATAGLDAAKAVLQGDAIAPSL